MIPATRFERVYGSPSMYGSPLDATLHSAFRREAAAMRSRAYLNPSAAEPWDAKDAETFCPERTAGTMAAMRASLPCPVCGEDCPSYGCWTQER